MATVDRKEKPGRKVRPGKRMNSIVRGRGENDELS